MARVDLTDPTLELEPVPQSADFDLCTFTWPGFIAADDVLEGFCRETIGDEPVGKLTSAAGNFRLHVATRQVTVVLIAKQTRMWFRESVITDANRLRSITFTLLHRDKDGRSREWSGDFDVTFAMLLGYTRGT